MSASDVRLDLGLLRWGQLGVHGLEWGGHVQLACEIFLP